MSKWRHREVNGSFLCHFKNQHRGRRWILGYFRNVVDSLYKALNTAFQFNPFSPLNITWKCKSQGWKEDTAYITTVLFVYDATTMSWRPNGIKIAHLARCECFLCFHFLPLLHKSPAISPRQAEQLSWSLPAILQFRSRTLLNPNGSGREKRLCVFPCSKRELEGQNFPQRSEGVATLIFSPHQSIPLCPPSLCELNSCTGLLISQE